MSQMRAIGLMLATLLPTWMAAQTLAFTHVTVIDATGRPAQRDQTVVIAGDRIAAIGKAGRLAVPKEATAVDGAGKFLIPGLWDMHVHTLRQGVFLRLYLANGITGVRDMSSPIENISGWRKAVADGATWPRVYAAGPLVDGPYPIYPRSIAVATAAEGRAAVATLKKLGADFVKIYSLLGREEYFALAGEAKKQGIPFAGHVPELVTAIEASDAGQKSFEHLMGIFRACSRREQEFLAEAKKYLAKPDTANFIALYGAQYSAIINAFDEKKAAALFQRLAANGTWQTPTLAALRGVAYMDVMDFAKDPRMKYVSRSQRAGWDPKNDFRFRDNTVEEYASAKRDFRKQVEVVGRMHRAGVPILAGSDTPNVRCIPGFSLHDELTLLVEAGLKPIEALQAATRNPARYFGIADSLGTVEAGKIADLVLLDANPLEDIRNTQRIAAVVVRGKLLARPQLDALLAEVEARVKE